MDHDLRQYLAVNVVGLILIVIIALIQLAFGH